MTLYCVLFEIYCIRPPVNVASSIRRCFQTSLPSIKKRALLMGCSIKFRWLSDDQHATWGHHNLRSSPTFGFHTSFIVSSSPAGSARLPAAPGPDRPAKAKVRKAQGIT